MKRRNFNRQILLALLGLALFPVLPASSLAASSGDNLKAWNAMPDAEKNEIKKRWEEFKAMSPEAKARLKEAYGKFNALPSEQKLLVLKNYSVWKALSPEKKQVLRERFRHWKSLSEAERDKIRALRTKALQGADSAE